MGLKFFVEVGLYDIKEEPAKSEDVLGRIRQAIIFLKKIISDFATWADLAVIFL